MKTKIYCITIDDVYDYNVTPHKPLLLFTRKDVNAAVKRMKDKAKRETPGWKLCNTGSGGFEMYLDGEYSCNHYAVAVHEYDFGVTVK